MRNRSDSLFTICELEIEGVGTHTMATYEHGGTSCITFVVPDENGNWINTPFPQELITCQDSMRTFIIDLLDRGYSLTGNITELTQQQNIC